MRRMLLAIVSSVALQSLFLCCLVLLVNLRAEYTRWFQQTWATITSLRMWVYHIIIVSLSCLQGILCSKTYLRTATYHKSRFARLCASLTTQNLYLEALHIIIGGILVWLHLSLMGGRYSSLMVECNDTHGTCLVEEHCFLLLSGLWSGLYLSIKTNGFSAFKCFRFPVIVQSKSVRLQRRIYATLPTLIVDSIWSTLYYMIGYYFLGSYCREALLSMFSMRTEYEPLDTISKLLNMRLMSQLWLHQFMFALTISITYLLFEIHLTEWIGFKLYASGVHSGNGSVITLIDALSMHEVPLMQHLAYFDLFTLAQKQQRRRKMLFTLSQPGGHPYNWNSMAKKCIDFLSKFSMDLNAVLTKHQDQTFCYSTKVLSMTVASVPQMEHSRHMRKLIPDTVPPLATQTDTKEATHAGWHFQRTIKQLQDSFMAYLLTKPLINYIFVEQDDNKIRYVLLNGQPVMWAAEALSFLAVSSLSEDSYGIVQKDLANIIGVLLSVKQALDKLHKSTTLFKKMPMNDKLFREMFVSLRIAIKRSLYRIVTEFKPYLNDFFLEPAQVEQLRSFLDYKE